MTLRRTGRVLRAASAAVPLLTAVHAAPVVATFGPLRNRLMPKLAGQGRADHVALTFDDGPDHLSTPHFLRLLDAREIRATSLRWVRSPQLKNPPPWK